MSTADTKNASLDETFASKGGFEMTTPLVFRELIEKFAGTRTVVTAVGQSGIGKTAIPKQVAAARNGGKGVPYVGLHVPTMTLEDCHIPTMAPDTKLYYDRRISRRFQVLLDWVAQVKLDNNGVVPPDLSPILAIEELNRAVDKSVTRAIFTLLDDRVIGDVHLDDSIQMVVTMNPTGGGMSVNEFERDPAMRRRLLSVGVAYNYGDFMNHATAQNFHPNVIAHLSAQPGHVYDELAAANGKVFACPATWESVSRTCYRFDELKAPLTSAAGRAAIAGAIGTGATLAFLDYVKNNEFVVTPDDVLTDYSETSETRKKFQSYFTEGGGGRLDKVTDLVSGLAIRVFANLKKPVASLAPSIGVFMNDLPVEIMMSFIEKLTEESNRLSNDGKVFFKDLTIELIKVPAYTEAVTRLHEARQKVAEETAEKPADATKTTAATTAKTPAKATKKKKTS